MDMTSLELTWWFIVVIFWTSVFLFWMINELGNEAKEEMFKKEGEMRNGT